jgi:hypothetical protein
MTEKKQLVFEPPDENTPGYLRRLMARDKFIHAIKSKDVTPEIYDDLIAFLLPYITQPEDRDEAKEALLDATEAQYKALLEAINPQVPTEPEPTDKS